MCGEEGCAPVFAGLRAQEERYLETNLNLKPQVSREEEFFVFVLKFFLVFFAQPSFVVAACSNSRLEVGVGPHDQHVCSCAWMTISRAAIFPFFVRSHTTASRRHDAQKKKNVFFFFDGRDLKAFGLFSQAQKRRSVCDIDHSFLPAASSLPPKMPPCLIIVEEVGGSVSPMDVEDRQQQQQHQQEFSSPASVCCFKFLSLVFVFYEHRM